MSRVPLLQTAGRHAVLAAGHGAARGRAHGDGQGVGEAAGGGARVGARVLGSVDTWLLDSE